MKSNELRIGNLVRNNMNGEILKPCDVLCDGINTENYEGFNYCFIEPIPITEEWLLKFGFQKRESSICNEWYIGKNEITHDWLFDIVWLLKPELINAPNYPFYKNGRHLIQYVHQLQNLYFALTDQELTFKS